MEGRVNSGQGRVVENFAKNHSRNRAPARKDDNRKRRYREASPKSGYTPNEKKAIRAIAQASKEEDSRFLTHSIRWWGNQSGLRRDIFMQTLWKLCRRKLIKVTTQMEGDIRRIRIEVLMEVKQDEGKD